MTTILINAAAGPLLDVAAKVLTHPDLPDAALFGGLAVTIRVAAHTTSYRATADVDLVTGDDTPTLVELLTRDHNSPEPVVIGDIKVDVIATGAVTDADLAGIDDGPRLFVAGHRWALDTVRRSPRPRERCAFRRRRSRTARARRGTGGASLRCCGRDCAPG